ncbi:MAG: aspartate aminotransferase family protein [Acidimicrobiales bacterium]
MPSWLSAYYADPITIVSGSNRRVRDADGVEYLDFLGGIASSIVGYGLPEIADAIKAQLDTGIVHTSTLFMSESYVHLAERLSELSGIRDAKVFFTNSGTEANEAAVLLATTARNSNEVLALRNGYHGWSAAAMAMTGVRGWRDSSLSPFNVHFVRSGDRFRGSFSTLGEDELAQACAADLRDTIMTATVGSVACLIAEPVQGAGGIVIPPAGYFSRAKSVLDEFEILLVADEIQTGFGRTGETFWAMTADEVVPDLITVAKGLGNGLPIGAVIGRPELMDCLGAGVISTFGGNPLAAVAALATIDYVTEHDLQSNAAKMGELLLEGLVEMARRYAAIGDVRGKGLMVGIEMVRPGTKEPNARAATALHESCRRRGLLIGKAGQLGQVLRLLPPLSLTEGEVEEALAILRAGFEEADRAGDL